MVGSRGIDPTTPMTPSSTPITCPPRRRVTSSLVILVLSAVDGHRKLPTGGHLWRILWPWFLPAYGQIVPHLL